MDYLGQLFWLFIIMMSLQPLLQRRMQERARLALMRRIERDQGCRLISLIHRQETMGFLGFPFFRYIDVDDSEQIIRAIRRTDDDQPIDLLLHTPGGLVLASLQIARALKAHPARTRVIVPHYAMSGGTLIAIAADEIVMDENAVLGPVDPQLGQAPAASVLRAVAKKEPKDVDDQTLILADQARMAVDQLREAVYELVVDRMGEEKAREFARQVAEGNWTHDYPITAADARAMGLQVSTDLPAYYYTLMDLYRQPTRRSPTVEYVPRRLSDK